MARDVLKRPDAIDAQHGGSWVTLGGCPGLCAECILEGRARSLELVAILLRECARNHPPDRSSTMYTS